jgi:osmotically-inducible protein OsmY
MTSHFKRLTLLSMVLTCAALTACNKPGPAEEAGRKIDESTERAEQAVRDKLDKAEDSAKDHGKKIDTAVSDADITAKVKLALMMRDGLNSLTISVKTQAGVVTLSGSVAQASQSKLANDLARAVDDVIRVDNQLLVVGPAK